MKLHLIDIAGLDAEHAPSFAGVEQLAQAIIDAGGLFKPLVVTAVGFDAKYYPVYRLITGRRELAAARIARAISPENHEAVTAFIVTASDLPKVSAHLELLYGKDSE